MSCNSECQKCWSQAKHQQSCIPPGGSRGEPLSWSFPTSGGCCIPGFPCLRLQTQRCSIFKPLSLLCFGLTSPCLALNSLLPSNKDTCDGAGPTQKIRDNLPISTSSIQVPLPCEVTLTGLRRGTWASGRGGHHSTTVTSAISKPSLLFSLWKPPSLLKIVSLLTN